jgi:hypothetical protein
MGKSGGNRGEKRRKIACLAVVLTKVGSAAKTGEEIRRKNNKKSSASDCV